MNIDKKYKVIMFDWDGTAVVSRGNPDIKVVNVMNDLLKQGIKLVVISGTSYENTGKYFIDKIPTEIRKNLYFGLDRGANSYGFTEKGERVTLHSVLPSVEEKSTIDQIAFELHTHLFEKYNYPTDIVFSRPNYCKIDLLVNHSRGKNLFIQANEFEMLNTALESNNIQGGVKSVIAMLEDNSKKKNFPLQVTTDLKYLEVGMSTKSDNVNYLLSEVIFKQGYTLEECCFWGDEFSYLGPGIRGSDAYLITPLSEKGEFFDVSPHAAELPKEVKSVGGGTESFINFLQSQLTLK